MTTSTTASGKAEIVSSSKDSIYIRWRFDGVDKNRFVDDDGSSSSSLSSSGYMIRYQAVGSSVIQKTPLLNPATSDFDITHLHENTNYDICVLRMRKSRPALTSGAAVLPVMTSLTLASSTSSPMDTVDKACIKGTTSTDSLSVALGSTFGAFLALGLIVALVFVAKWQHVHRGKKRLAALDGREIGAELDDIEDVFRAEEPISGNYDSGVLAALTFDSGELGPAPGSDHRSSASDPEIRRSTSRESCCRSPPTLRVTHDECFERPSSRSSHTSAIDDVIANSPQSPTAGEPRRSASGEHVIDVDLEQSSGDVDRMRCTADDAILQTAES